MVNKPLIRPYFLGCRLGWGRCISHDIRWIFLSDDRPSSTVNSINRISSTLETWHLYGPSILVLYQGDWDCRSYWLRFKWQIWTWKNRPPLRCQSYHPKKLRNDTGESTMNEHVGTPIEPWGFFQPVMLVFGGVLVEFSLFFGRSRGILKYTLKNWTRNPEDWCFVDVFPFQKKGTTKSASKHAPCPTWPKDHCEI